MGSLYRISREGSGEGIRPRIVEEFESSVVKVEEI